MTDGAQTDTSRPQAHEQPAPSPEMLARMQALMTGMGIAHVAAQAPDRPAVISETYGTRTFAELNAAANKLVRALRSRGIGQGDSLGLVCSNRPEFVEILTAIQRMGVRATPINWHLTGEEIAYVLCDCEAKVVVGDVRFASALNEASRQIGDDVVRVAIGTGPGKPAELPGFESYEDLLAGHSGEDIEDPIAGGTMLYTSGTTGRPKGVHRPAAGGAADGGTGAAARRARAAQADGGGQPQAATGRRASNYVPEEDVHLLTGPGYHAAPLAFSIRGPLAQGVGIVMMDGWDPEETLRLIDRYKVTHTHMVPTMFHRLLALPEEVKARYDVSSLRYVLHGAAPCPVEVKQALMDWLGPIVHEYYAATEGGGTSIGPEEWLSKPGSVGRPNPNQVIEIWDDENAKLPAGQVGTIFFKAPERGRFEYYKDPEKTSSAYRGDYFTLGDMGYFDEDGYLYLTGRSAEVIISGGVNIYPAEVDAVLLTHAAVADVACVGVPNDEWGEEVKAVVLLKDGAAASDGLAHELIAYCRDRLAHFKCPRSVDFTDDLPRHDTGKIYRRLVRDRYWAGAERSI